MALYRDIQFHKGSPTDIMGSVPTVTGATFNKDKKGWALQTGSGKYVQYDRQLLPDGAFSVVVWAKITNGYVTNNTVNIIGVTTTGLEIAIVSTIGYGGAPIIRSSVNNYRTFTYTQDKKWHCFIFTITGSSQIDINNAMFYVDNTQKSTAETVATAPQNARSGYVYVGGGSIDNIGNISRIKVYNHVLTTKEREREQIEFEAAQPLTYQKRQLQLPKPTELKQSGLVAAYNMKPVGNILHDISGNGNHGAISGYPLTGLKGMSNWIKGVVNITANTTLVGDISFSFRCYIKGTGGGGFGRVFENVSTAIRFDAVLVNGLIFTRDASTLAKSGAIITNNWYNISITSTSTGISSIYINGSISGTPNQTIGVGTQNTAWNIGNITSLIRSFDGTIQDLRIYKKILSPQEIKAYHNSFNEVILHEKFEDMAVGSSKLPNGWVKSGGSFVCAESTTNDTVIKSIRKGAKYLRCVTAGIVAIHCKWVNGTIKNNIYKAGNTVNDWLFTSTVIGAFNATGQNGYLLRWDTDNKFKLYKITNGVLSAALITSVNTYPPSWYEPTVTRTTSGVFTVYINGVSIGTATDTTFNTSNYNQHSCIANDRITNINIQSQIKA